jgi:hypothetical protein
VVFQGGGSLSRLVHSRAPQGCSSFPARDCQTIRLPFLLNVSDKLFSGRVLEEKVFAVLMLEKLTGEFSVSEFKLFESLAGSHQQLGRS